MESTTTRRKRRCGWAAAMYGAVIMVGVSTPLLSGQTPTQPTPPAQPSPPPAAKGRTRVRTGQPPSQPQPADETKIAPDGTTEKSPEGETPQPQTPPQPAAPRPVRSTPSKEGEPNQPTAKPVAPPGSRAVEPSRETAAQPTPQLQPPSPQPAQPQPPPQPAAATPKKPDEAEMDPAKRVEEARKAAVDRAAKRARPGQPGDALGKPTPGQPAGLTPPPEAMGDAGADGGPSTPVNIAPEQSDVPPEARLYGFSIKDGTYEQLVEGFARQTGLGVIGDVPKDGKVTFVTTETLTFDQALVRVRKLLFNYKPLEPYWIERNETNLRVIKVNDYYRILPRNRMFHSVDEFRAANLASDELALVVYTPKNGSVADLKQVRDWMPDYVRVTPLEDQNSVTIYALVSDIEKYLGLIDFIHGTRMDPRTLEKIEVRHILANEALNRLRQLMDIDNPAPGRPAAAVPKRAPREPSALDSMPEPPVTVIADDAQGILLVRAMQDKIDEIKALLPFLDVDNAGPTPAPVIVRLQYVDANEMIATLQQILSTSGAPPGVPTPPKVRKTTPKKSGPAPSAAAPAAGGTTGSENITLLPHPSDNAIIVIADDDGVNRVRDLVALFDVVTKPEPVRIPLSHADSADVLNTVTAVLGGPSARGKPALERFLFVADPAGDAMWFAGSDKDLARVQGLIAAIDLAEEPVSLHVATLKYQQPTFVSNMLREFDGSTASSPTPAPAKQKPKTKRVKAVAASKFTPDDPTKRLFILCNEYDWARYQPLIAQLDRPTDEGEVFVRLPLQHADPNTAIERLSAMLPPSAGNEEAVRFIPSEGSILAIGASPLQMERIKVFLTEVDKPSHVEQRTFEIRHANPADIKSAIESLIADMPAKPQPRRRGKGEVKAAGAPDITTSDELTIVQLGQRLIVQTTPSRMEQIASLIKEFDVEDAKTELKVYSDFPPGTNIESISDTVSSVFAGPGRITRPRGGKEAAAAMEGPKFIPQPASGRLVVIADPSVFPEIERLLTVLRREGELRPPVVAFVEVKYADPAELVESIKPLLDIKIRGLVESGELDETVEDAGAAGKVPKRTVLPPSATSNRYHLAADARNNRIVIAAPQVVVDQAKALIAQFDKPGEKPIFKTVELKNASPDEMIRAVKEMLGRPVMRRVAGTKGKPAVPAVDLSGGEGLSVVEAPGGGAIILHGTTAEVAQAEDWINKLDAMSSRGRTIKVYKVKSADMTKVYDLVVNVVGASSPAPGGIAAQRPSRGSSGKGGESKGKDEEEFTTKKTFAGPDLYIQADLLGRTMMVATVPSKIAQIDDILASVDASPEKDPGMALVMGAGERVPHFDYDLQHADAVDAKWALEDALTAKWQPHDEMPQVDGFGSTLTVRYPHEERFDEIRDIIRKYADKPDPKTSKIVKKSFPAPPGLSAKEVAALLKINHTDYDVQLEDITPKSETQYPIRQIRPPTMKKANPCVLPGAFQRATDGVLGSIVGQTQAPKGPQGQPEAQPSPEEEPVPEQPDEAIVPVPSGDDMIRQVIPPSLPRKSSKKSVEPEKSSETKTTDKSGEKSSEKGGGKKGAKGERLIVHYDEDAGVIQVEGQAGDIEGVSDWIDEIKDQIKDFPVKPDIRIYQVTYIDVYTAQDILEEMFNATKQQQAAFQQQQQQMLRQQQMQQQQQQRQGQQPGVRGQPGEQGGPGAPGGVPGRPGVQPAIAAQQMAMPQLPQAGVRIYPNPRDRSLILRAETSQYPQIEELLATIDQPKPIESFMRTYPLKNLNAVEVEEILREMLRIVKGPSRPKAAASKTPGVAGPSGAAGGPGDQLPQTILQDTVTGLPLNLDPDDIKLFSSEISNTVMAMAPKAGLDFIGQLIDKLEREDMPQRVTKYYELKNADVGDAAAYLESHFEEALAARKGKKGGEGAGAGSKSLNTPSFVAYSRLNLLTVQATQTQIEEIDKILERIDVSGGTDKWEDRVLAYADAKLVADTLTQMFTDKSAAAAGTVKGSSKATVAKFIGESGGGIVLFSAPPSLREQILATISKLEEQNKTTRTPRIIELKNATPSAIADAIEKAYDTKRAGGKPGGGAAARFTVTAHDPTKRLFVTADDKTFAEVESLARLLDDKPGTIGVEFRIYPLKYASAKPVHAMMTKLLKDYMQRLGQAANQIEAFSVEPDEMSNSLIVLGGPIVFGFIEENLRRVDTPQMVASKPASLIVPLINANAAEVAQTVQKLYATKEQPLGMTPPQVEANPSTNTLIVRGTQSQIDEIKRDIIDPLEAQDKLARQVQVKPIKLKFADPAGAADVINKLFRSDGKSARDQVQASADFTSNSVIVSASPENFKRVEDLIAQIDSAETSQQDVHVVEIKHADATSVAQTLTEIFIRSAAKQVGNQAPPISISAVTGSRAMLIKCKAEDFARIADTIKELDTEDVGTGGEVRLVTLLYSDANEVAQALEKYLKTSGPGGKLLGDARVGAMPQTNSVMISAAKEEVERLVEIAHRMDVAGEKGSVPQIIPLKYANVGMILSSVQEVFTEARGGGGRRNQPPPVVVADEGSNALIVRASPTDLAAIQGIVAQLDTEEKKDRTPFRIIKVAPGINVVDLAQQVETTLNESAQAQAGTGRNVRVQRVAVEANVRTNSLVVSGYSAMFDQAEALVRKLEELGPSGDVSTRIVRVGNIKVDQIQKMIDQLTQQPSGTGTQRGSRPRPTSRPRSGP